MPKFQTVNQKLNPLILKEEFSGFSQGFLLNEKPFNPKVYDGTEEPDSSFNAVCLHVEAQANSQLQWDLLTKKAESYTSKGLLILWELNLGLQDLGQQLASDDALYQAVEFSLTHFLKTLWAPYASKSLGVILFRAKAQQKIPLEALRIFASLLPDSLAPFLAFDAEGISTCFEAFQLLCCEELAHFHLIVKGKVFERFPYALAAIGLETTPSCFGNLGHAPSPLLTPKPLPLAVVFPKKSTLLFEKTLESLEEHQISFRLVPEGKITASWEGVDYFIAFPEALSHQGMRKLLGFCAAGGTVIPIGEKGETSFPSELSLDHFLRSQS